MLQVVFVAALVGIAAYSLGERAAPFVEFDKAIPVPPPRNF